MDNGPLGGYVPPFPVPPVALASSAGSSRSSRDSLDGYGRQSLKSLERLLGDDRDPRKLKRLVHKLYDNLKFEKDRADYADRQASEAVSYLKSICEEKLRAMREISRLEEELKLYKIQYEEAQKEIFRAQRVIGEVDEKRFQAEKEAADARSAARKMKDQINVMNAQDEGRRQGLEEGFKKGREMGYREGLRMAQSELENIARAGPPSSPSSPDARIPSQSGGASHGSEPQLPPQHSRDPSTLSSRQPTAHGETPSSPSIPQDSIPAVVQSMQPMPEMPEEPEIIRPRSIRGPSPSPRIPLSAIPPDNYIPHLEGDNRIHLPPPHEFSRLPPSPEPPTPTLASAAENETPRMIPPKVSTHFQTAPRRSTSPTSASTTLSHMDIVTDPYNAAGISPMSAIPESLSREGSPEAQDAASLAGQPSFGMQSARMMASGSNEPIYTRPRTASGASSISVQPPVIPDPGLRTSVSTTSSGAPNITVRPPVRSPPFGFIFIKADIANVFPQLLQSASGSGSNFPVNPQSGLLYTNPNIEALSPILEADSQPTNTTPLPAQPPETFIPSAMHSEPMPGDWHYDLENTSADNINPPVIPHPDLYTEMGDDEDAVSSGFGSEHSLTTPPMRQERLPSRAGSVKSAGGSVLSHQTGAPGRSQSRAGGSQAGTSRAGSALGTQAGQSRAGSALGTVAGPSGEAEEEYQPDWNQFYVNNFSVPPRVPQLPPDLQSASGRAPSRASTKKGKGSVLSMSSSRNGQ
ncbi:hypothetical protein NP233_g4790 [Leucocoprinus birnbaumii]|uniref:Uncharacterized protein n=1 Tax=Leucocoprinus birnbaumii TaxID=56174 RepID=A0AAD5YV66_9AGAR|nr:hypothetical protein NP233_g4790 [Leucocoprinus birnbaumii]